MAKQQRQHEVTPGRPPRRWVEHRDRGAYTDAGAWGSGRGLRSQQGAPDEAPFRDDVHGGDPAERDDDYGQTYEGRMRAYRNTTGSSRAVPTAQADGEPRMVPREDDNILEDLVDLLARDRGIDDDKIQVYVCDGNVRLEGQTCSHRSSNRAERLAKLVDGVRSVDNRLRIVERSR